MGIECKICHNWFNDVNELTLHIRRDHKITVQSYYDTYVKKPDEGKCKNCGKPTKFNGYSKGYAEFCSVSCARTKQIEDQASEYTCAICNEVIHGKNVRATMIAFATHIRNAHGIYEPRLYYDKFVKKEDEGKCPICGKDTKFNSISKGYDQYCSVECAAAGAKQDENSHNSRVHLMAVLKEKAKTFAEKVSEKYHNFLRKEKKSGFSDVRENTIKQENIKDERLVETVDGSIAQVKTEISMSTQRDPWMGTQTKYTPKMENCYKNPYFDEIIDNGEGINETEWCR